MSTIRAGWAAIAVVALGACTSRPVMQPAPSPVFESNVRNDDVREGPVEPARPGVFVAPSVPEEPRAAPAPEQGPGSTGASMVPPLPGGSAQSATEHVTICDSLRHRVRAEVVDMEGGARLILRPFSAGEMERLRDAAGDLDRAAAAGSGSSTEACVLFQLAAQGADIRVREAPDAMEVEITGQGDLKGAIRSGVRRFAEPSAPPPK
jgi:hypothetical protein